MLLIGEARENMNEARLREGDQGRGIRE